MTSEESQELYEAVNAVELQDVHLGRVLKSIISYLPGFALPEPAPVVEEAAPVSAPVVAEEGA